MELPRQIENAARSFQKLPGVGRKTAVRYALSMIDWGRAEREKFLTNLEDLQSLQNCVECGIWCEENTCQRCLSPKRQASHSLCVVESSMDCWILEKAQQFQGLYHILGGVLNPLLGIHPENLRIQELLARVKKYSITEVILAVGPSVEGDITSSYLKDQLGGGVNVFRPALGVPVGASFEHLDQMTLSVAFENRMPF